MKHRKWFSFLLILSLLPAGCTGAPGVSPSPTAPVEATATPAATASPSPIESATPGPASAELRIMLPDEIGYRWQYYGFAEYGHEMTLDVITPGPEGTRYQVTGEVYDLSDGESDRDFSLSLSYIVSGESIVQEKNAPMMMDSAFDRLELIRTPLRKGAVWEQTVRDASGQDVTLTCTIEDIEGNAGGRTYTVLYQDTASEYYERREIRDGTGVVRFEKLHMPEGEEPFPIGYSLYSQADALRSQLGPYLPPLDTELRYFGLAEYGHVGRLTLTSDNDREAIYTFDGIFQDGSGIDAPFQVRYYVDYTRGTVTEMAVSNDRSGEAEINSKLHNVVILKFPLDEGATWSHQTTINGKQYTVRARITEYDPDTGLVKVRYTAEGVPGYHKDTYIEERTFEHGYGMTAFQNIFPGKVTVQPGETEEQAVVNHMFGYSLDKGSAQ